MGRLTSIYGRIINLSEFIKSVNLDAKIVASGSVGVPILEVLLKNSEIDIICTDKG